MAMQYKLWTAYALSVEFGISYKLCQQKLAGLPPFRREGARNFYRMVDAAAALLGRPRDPAVIDFDEAKNRKMAAEAKLAEHELAEKEGTAVSADEITAELDRRLMPARAKLLGLPVKLSPMLDPEQPQRARDILERAIHEVLSELAAEAADDDADVDAGREEAA